MISHDVRRAFGWAKTKIARRPGEIISLGGIEIDTELGCLEVLQQSRQFGQGDIERDGAKKPVALINRRGNGNHHSLACFIEIGRRPENIALRIVLRQCHFEYIILKRLVGVEKFLD